METIKRLENSLIDNGHIASDVTISENSNMRDDLGLDSLDIVEMNMNIDSEFGLEINDEVWIEADCQTIGEVIKVIEAEYEKN